MNGKYGNNIAPINEGEKHDVKIESVGDKGDGVARIKGFVVFVPGVKTGDEVRIKITKVLAKVGFAELTDEKPEPKKEEVKRKEEKELEKEEEIIYDTSKDTEDFGEE